MSNTNTGGPAFPHLRRHVGNNTYEQLAEGGMTLRDYFAAKAMQGLFASGAEHDHDDAEIFDVVAEAAYKQADAMLKAREQ
jgi:hypothetical protein